jgi:hypothetical protein
MQGSCPLFLLPGLFITCVVLLDKIQNMREFFLGDIQRQLNEVPYRKSADPGKYALYVAKTYEHWNELWKFAGRRKLRKLRFRADMLKQRELDREVQRLCQPREGDAKTVLVYGNAAKKDLFGRIKNNVKGPAKKIFTRAVQRKAAVCIWADEFRTSKLGVDGRLAIHPLETREHKLEPRRCRAEGPVEAHDMNTRGCRCFCHKAECNERRTKKSFCGVHFNPKKAERYNVCYSNQSSPSGQYTTQHRMWNRDVMAAVNIGCRFLAKALGLTCALWERGTKIKEKDCKLNETVTPPKSWDAIFRESNHSVPFSVVSKRQSQ